MEKQYQITVDDGIHPPVTAALSRSQLKHMVKASIVQGVLASQVMEDGVEIDPGELDLMMQMPLPVPESLLTTK